MPALRFRLFGFPVQVLPGYWLITALFSFAPGHASVRTGLMMMLVMFVSILVHELGHALAARAFGMSAQITLHAMGGATTFPPRAELTRLRDVVISVAGPGAGLLLAALGWVLLLKLPQATGDEGAGWSTALNVLVLINTFWSIVNLIPVIPFDGGRVLAAMLGPKHRMLTATISLCVGIAAAAGFAYVGYILAAVLFASSAVSSFLQARQAPPKVEVLPFRSIAEACRAAQVALDSEQWDRVELLTRAILGGPASPAELKQAAELLLWSRFNRGDARGARTLLPSLPSKVDAYLIAAIHEAAGYPKDAREAIIQARTTGDTRIELTALLVRILLTEGKAAAAANLTREIVASIPPEEVRRVATEATTQGAKLEAAQLRAALAQATRTVEDATAAFEALRDSNDTAGQAAAETLLQELTSKLTTATGEPAASHVQTASEPPITG